jgi:hypothetical protein
MDANVINVVVFVLNAVGFNLHMAVPNGNFHRGGINPLVEANAVCITRRVASCHLVLGMYIFIHKLRSAQIIELGCVAKCGVLEERISLGSTLTCCSGIIATGIVVLVLNAVTGTEARGVAQCDTRIIDFNIIVANVSIRIRDGCPNPGAKRSTAIPKSRIPGLIVQVRNRRHEAHKIRGVITNACVSSKTIILTEIFEGVSVRSAIFVAPSASTRQINLARQHGVVVEVGLGNAV